MTIQGQSAVAWINESTGRNRAAWLSISDFLARENLREVLQARAAEARAHAGVSACAGAWRRGSRPRWALCPDSGGTGFQRQGWGRV